MIRIQFDAFRSLQLQQLTAFRQRPFNFLRQCGHVLLSSAVGDPHIAGA